MDELREKVAGMFLEALLAHSNGPEDRAIMDEANEYADRILAIPEIAEALACQAAAVRSGLTVQQDGHLGFSTHSPNLGHSIGSTDKRKPV